MEGIDFSKLKVEKPEVNPAYAAEKVEDIVDRVRELRITLPAKAEDALRMVEATNRKLADAAFTEDGDGTGFALMEYINSLQKLIQEDTFWENVPDTLPPTSQERDVYTASINMLSDTKNGGDEHSENQRLSELARAQKRLAGDTKADVREQLNKAVLDLLKARESTFISGAEGDSHGRLMN